MRFFVFCSFDGKDWSCDLTDGKECVREFGYSKKYAISEAIRVWHVYPQERFLFKELLDDFEEIDIRNFS